MKKKKKKLKKPFKHIKRQIIKKNQKKIPI